MAVGLFGGGSKTNSAACESIVRIGGGHSDRATDNGVSAGQVHISDEIELSLSDGTEGAWSILVVLLSVVAGSAILTNVWVEDVSGGLTAVSQVAKSANLKLGVVGALDIAPDLGLVRSGRLGQVNKSSNVCLLIGVIKDALGEDSLVVSGVRVRSLLELVAVVGNERLGVSFKVVDAIAGILFPAVGSLASVAAIVATARAAVVATTTSVAETATREFVAATLGAISATRGAVALLPLGRHGNHEGCESSCEFHFNFGLVC